jgi:hypothetical protein
MAQTDPHPKVGGKKLAEFNNLVIYGSFKRAKRDGKDRVWIQIRQGATKPLRVSTCLAYARSVDIQFVEDYD